VAKLRNVLMSWSDGERFGKKAAFRNELIESCWAVNPTATDIQNYVRECPAAGRAEVSGSGLKRVLLSWRARIWILSTPVGRERAFSKRTSELRGSPV
jgi:hypothetical protein